MPPRAWRCAPRGPAPAHPAAARRPRRAAPGWRRRAPDSGQARTAGPARDIRIGSLTRSRRRACGRATTPGTTPMPAPYTSVWATPCGTKSWNSTTRSVRAIAPADQATTRAGRCGATWNRCSTLASSPTCPPAIASADDPSRSVLDLVTMSGHRRSLLRAPGVVERLLDVSHPLQVLLVQQLYDAQRVGQRPLAQPGPRVGATGDVVRRTERVVELHQVELAQLGQGSLVLALGMGVLAVLLVDSQPARVQGQVHGPEPHQLAQLGVVDLAFLPPRRHGGHHGLRIEVPRRTCCRFDARLGTQQRDLRGSRWRAR